MARNLVIAALLVAALPTTAASAATLRLQAPREVDRAEKFKVTAFGKAKPERAYYLSVLYHDDDQGRCEPTIEKEVTRNQHAEIFYIRRVRTDEDGRFERSRNIFGGDRETSGKFCGYLTNAYGKNKDTVVRRIAFS
jgi:hypothetical protein